MAGRKSSKNGPKLPVQQLAILGKTPLCFVSNICAPTPCPFPLQTTRYTSPWHITDCSRSCGQVRRTPGADIGVPLPPRDDQKLWRRQEGCRKMGGPHRRHLLRLAKHHSCAMGQGLGQDRSKAHHLDRSHQHHDLFYGLGHVDKSPHGHHRPSHHGRWKRQRYVYSPSPIWPVSNRIQSASSEPWWQKWYPKRSSSQEPSPSCPWYGRSGPCLARPLGASSPALPSTIRACLGISNSSRSIPLRCPT